MHCRSVIISAFRQRQTGQCLCELHICVTYKRSGLTWMNRLATIMHSENTPKNPPTQATTAYLLGLGPMPPLKAQDIAVDKPHTLSNIAQVSETCKYANSKTTNADSPMQQSSYQSPDTYQAEDPWRCHPYTHRLVQSRHRCRGFLGPRLRTHGHFTQYGSSRIQVELGAPQ